MGRIEKANIRAILLLARYTKDSGQKRVIAALATAYPKPLSINELIKIMWSDGNEPANAKRDLSTYFNRARDFLEPAGFSIPMFIGRHPDGERHKYTIVRKGEENE